MKGLKTAAARLALAFAALASAAAGAAPPARTAESFEIEWGKPFSLGAGGYARIRRLADGRYMAVCAIGADLAARYSRKGAPDGWSEPQIVARRFAAAAGGETGAVALANAEAAQLETGRIVFACNLRPENPKAHPYGIAVATSDDGGRTWSPLKTVYRAEVPGRPEAPSRGCGCWEPFVLPLGGARAQIYFADESPFYRPGKPDSQCISHIETADGGETWSAPERACHTRDRRDGMPVLLDCGGWRYMAIEANPGETLLHPQIVARRADGTWKTAARFEPLAEPPDWNKVYGGAPYIAETDNFMLLSWQESAAAGNRDAAPTARVAAVPKKEIAPDGTFATMRGVSAPPAAGQGGASMLWNSLCHAGGDSFLLVSETGGRITVHPARIVRK